MNEFQNNYTKYVLEDTSSKTIYYKIISAFVCRLLDINYGEWIKSSLDNKDMQGINNAI